MCSWVALAAEEGGAGGSDGVKGSGGHVLAVNDVVSRCVGDGHGMLIKAVWGNGEVSVSRVQVDGSGGDVSGHGKGRGGGYPSGDQTRYTGKSILTKQYDGIEKS
jgi:hypothetical protein